MILMINSCKLLIISKAIAKDTKGHYYHFEIYSNQDDLNSIKAQVKEIYENQVNQA